MKKHLLSMMCSLVILYGAQAQERTISGKVTSAEDDGTLPGVTVVLKGTTSGSTTDLDGNYKISIPASGGILVYSFVGLASQEIEVGNRSVIDIVMQPDAQQLTEVVVTALGISREKRSLGYATQEVEGDELSKVQSDNFVNALSGRVAGVNIKRTTNFGGSTNVIVRGSASLNGNNQALFVIDGVPIANRNTNTRGQSQDGAGYDYGNSVSDINPSDIESVNVLKGAAATALYGSRAANGVVMITTKKGNQSKKGFGVSLNSSVAVGSIIKSTFPEYQTNYGAGYGGEGFGLADGDGDGVDDDPVVGLGDDASFGPKFTGDPVYHWDSIDPDMPGFQQARPWVNSPNGAITYFETPVNWNNTVTITNGGDYGSIRVSYTNTDMSGIMPNSSLKRHNFSVGTQMDVSEKLKVSSFANYIKTDAVGRNATGYNANIMTSYRQWWQTNVDVKRQRDAYFSTGRNVTWNPNSAASNGNPPDPSPAYWDNPYWYAYENYQSDNRSRFIGNMMLTYQITDWLSVMGRVAADTYSELQEERKAVGSHAENFGIGEGADGSINQLAVTSGYLRRDITSGEYNIDFSLNFDKDLTEDLNLKGLLGYNRRRTSFTRLINATNGGLSVPGVYSLQNSQGPLPLSKELDSEIGVNGMFGSLSFGYKNMIFLDATLRRDYSSTLPTTDNVYWYPSLSTSFVFSNLLNVDAISFGKVRANYAQVGNSAPFDYLLDSYVINTPVNDPSTALSNTKKNAQLKPETTTSYELGVEMEFLDGRVGFDAAYYQSNSKDQIVPVRVSESSGYLYKVINAGEIENKGVELALYGSPIRTSEFSWNIGVNFTRNRNKVLSLTDGLENLQLGSYGDGVTMNARVGEPYGVLFGTDYTYLNPDDPKDSERLVDASGNYVVTPTSDNSIGNVNPNWTAGITNTFKFKGLTLSALIDIQDGGSIFSLDQAYGLATGLYAETDYINDLGNPVRNTLADGGGYINQGVQADGSVNTVRHQGDHFGAFGYVSGGPNRAHVYDAGYIKLREVSLTYDLPSSLLSNIFIQSATVGVFGSNLAILKKHLPHADPESGLGSGNLQGYSIGSLPSVREIGFNVKLTF
ncbi:SusC/RagA family TonB-linked outer membrane protein [Reichenbachiella carrageenanivorans]|uniref:SusC/RagA family TonB-linked outer membrane protein n=1 Tax=Reichenbachiella carrageenanivorans TaxID=2979869 RepID=A0ABY6D4Z1_9BACT|nr:SusC/RagA family TonB-linked outer membrane protein [Reichenbachiella carrageenanivorans]UXX81206.1 SusC/RagA family TonB-linked outer membrane protein [Reichenbachiella carrageenanivorans]